MIRVALVSSRGNIGDKSQKKESPAEMGGTVRTTNPGDSSSGARVTTNHTNTPGAAIPGEPGQASSVGATTGEPKGADLQSDAQARLSNPDRQIGKESRLLTEPKQYSSDLAMIGKYLGCGQFTIEQIAGILRKMGTLVARNDERISIAALKALIDVAKLQLAIAKANKPTPGATPVDTRPAEVVAESKPVESPKKMTPRELQTDKQKAEKINVLLTKLIEDRVNVPNPKESKEDDHDPREDK